MKAEDVRKLKEFLRVSIIGGQGHLCLTTCEKECLETKIKTYQDVQRYVDGIALKSSAKKARS